MTKSKSDQETKKEVKLASTKALKDFHLFQPPHIDLAIKKGDDLAKLDKMYHNNLVTEGVLKGK